MFKRLLLEDTTVIFTLTAFVTAVSLFVAMTWRALRMKRPQVEHFAQLPFNTPTPSARDESHTSDHAA